MKFRKIQPEELAENPFKMIGKDWLLLTVEVEGKVNPMTVSWGAMGVIWGKDVVYVNVRPERFTHKLIENADSFSLSLMDNSYRRQLAFCGAKSGRDFDKVKECGFTVGREKGTAFIEQSKLVLICKKLYSARIERGNFENPQFADEWYGEKGGFHTTYIAEIDSVLVKD